MLPVNFIYTPYDPIIKTDLSVLFGVFISTFIIYIPFLIILIIIHYQLINRIQVSYVRWIIPLIGLILLIYPLFILRLDIETLMQNLAYYPNYTNQVLLNDLTVYLVKFLPHLLFILIPLIMNKYIKHIKR